MKKSKKIASMMLTLSLLVGLLPQSVEATYSGISSPTRDANGNVTYSCIYFGNYWQADTNGDGRADKNDSKEPIKWK